MRLWSRKGGMLSHRNVDMGSSENSVPQNPLYDHHSPYENSLLHALTCGVNFHFRHHDFRHQKPSGETKKISMVPRDHRWNSVELKRLDEFKIPQIRGSYRLIHSWWIKKLLCFEWSPPWHFKTACWHHFCLKFLSRDFCPTNYPNHLFHLAGHCACQSVKQDINMSVGHVK